MSADQTPLAAARRALEPSFKADTGTARPRWRVVITDSESPTGVAPVCTGDRSDALHMIEDYPGGPQRDEEGVYDCCPWPQFDVYDAALATYLVELLNADGTVPDFFQPGYTYSDTDPEWRFRCDTVTTHPEDGERTALGWRFFRGEWDAIAYGEDDWDLCKFDGRDATGVPRG